MSYLVRKINKKKNIDLLQGELDFNSLSADVPTGEFKTINGTLSTWFIESLEELDNAVLAITVTSSKISKMDFVVIDTNVLKKYNLDYKQTFAGRYIAIPDLQDTHYDIVDLTMSKLKECVLLYKDIVDNNIDDKFVVRYAEGQIKSLMKNAIISNRVEIKNAEGNIKEVFLEMKEEIKI